MHAQSPNTCAFLLTEFAPALHRRAPVLVQAFLGPPHDPIHRRHALGSVRYRQRVVLSGGGAAEHGQRVDSVGPVSVCVRVDEGEGEFWAQVIDHVES